MQRVFFFISHITIAAAVAALRLSAPEFIGIISESEQLFIRLSETPCPSFPIAKQSPGLKDISPKIRLFLLRHVQKTQLPAFAIRKASSGMLSEKKGVILNRLPIAARTHLGLYISAQAFEKTTFSKPIL